MVVKDQFDNLYLKGGSTVIVQAQSNRGCVIPVEVKDEKDGSYSASFIANQIGEVKLSITAKGQQIKGSPLSIQVNRKYTTTDKPSTIVNEGGRMAMGKPYHVAFGRDGSMYAVVDQSFCVWIFDQQDQFIKNLQ